MVSFCIKFATLISQHGKILCKKLMQAAAACFFPFLGHEIFIVDDLGKTMTMTFSRDFVFQGTYLLDFSLTSRVWLYNGVSVPPGLSHLDSP